MSSRPPPPSARLETLVRALVARERNAAPTPAQRGAATARLCEQLSDHLSRIVGRAGVRALFERSMILTQADHPWLGEAVTKSPATSWGLLASCLERQPPDVAFEASIALITRFLEMLGRFIGDGLVLRLLQEVWPDVFPPAQKDPE